MKFAAADGEILWRVQDPDSTRLDDRGWAVVVGPDDHPVVTGMHSGVTDPADYRTFKLDGADGSELWGRTVPGAVNFTGQRAGWLAVCDNGDIVMANRTWEAATGYDVVLHRYLAGSGEPVWTTRYDSGGTEDPVHMTRDAAGDLLVAGIRSGDFMALKFDAVNGGLVWSADYDGPGAGYDAAAVIMEGPRGDVIVTGFTTGVTTSWDVTTVALEATDGTLRWAAHFDPGVGGADEGKALAVGPLDDLYVVGSCEGPITATDLLALRYSLTSTTGAVAGTHADAPISSPLRLTAWPNPFVRRLTLSLEITRAAPVGLAVYDVRGRRAASLHDGPLTRGTHRIEWSGLGDLGRPLASGVYLIRLQSAGTTVVEKVVLSR